MIELPIKWQKSSYQPHLIALIDSKGKWIADVPNDEIAMIIISALEERLKRLNNPVEKLEEKKKVTKAPAPRGNRNRLSSIG
ncbi:hypothetical protein IT6_00230 [Methylacidiphilum caldifontis]|uniref:hypothetical protein n=1 Tax=Methylacidiphilum caldifontis TaxID=2795386 RepID=UPI001A8D9CC9|nr:hypothetical protein [Methylacidiphilum caldifontis]QSR88777.1 hypothetical protein IT6_00230 [Methylacidiphilum caldifontis]